MANCGLGATRAGGAPAPSGLAAGGVAPLQGDGVSHSQCGRSLRAAVALVWVSPAYKGPRPQRPSLPGTGGASHRGLQVQPPLPSCASVPSAHPACPSISQEAKIPLGSLTWPPHPALCPCSTSCQHGTSDGGLALTSCPRAGPDRGWLSGGSWAPGAALAWSVCAEMLGWRNAEATGPREAGGVAGPRCRDPFPHFLTRHPPTKALAIKQTLHAGVRMRRAWSSGGEDSFPRNLSYKQVSLISGQLFKFNKKNATGDVH